MIEIEAKFININKEEVIAKLEKLGAQKVFDERLLRRCVYDSFSGGANEWIRIRDEVDKVTMTYKNILANKVDGVKEIELIIDSFEKGRDFLKALGLKERAYQESKRIRYNIPSENVEFDIDTWPGLEPWIEIEAKSEDTVRKYARLLGFKWKDAMFGSADLVYEKIYNVSAHFITHECPVLKFGHLPKELSKDNLRNNS